MTSSPPRSNCPLCLTLDILGDRWSLLIMRDNLLFGARRYGDFLKAPEGISTNILAARLQLLEKSGLLEKLADPQDRKSAYYFATERGIALLPILVEAVRWGTREFDGSPVPEPVRTLMERGCEPYIVELSDRIHAEKQALTA